MDARGAEGRRWQAVRARVFTADERRWMQVVGAARQRLNRRWTQIDGDGIGVCLRVLRERSARNDETPCAANTIGHTRDGIVSCG